MQERDAPNRGLLPHSATASARRRPPPQEVSKRAADLRQRSDGRRSARCAPRDTINLSRAFVVGVMFPTVQTTAAKKRGLSGKRMCATTTAKGEYHAAPGDGSGALPRS